MADLETQEYPTEQALRVAIEIPTDAQGRKWSVRGRELDAMLRRFRYTPAELKLIADEVALLRHRWEQSQFYIRNVLHLGGSS